MTALEQTLQEYYTVVEEAIQTLNIDPKIARGNQEGQWNLKRSEREIWIDLWRMDKDQRVYFQVLSPVMEAPATQLEMLFKELLTLNDSLIGAAFTIYKDWIYLKVIREATGMDSQEALEMMKRVSSYAIEYTPKLRAKYHAHTRAARSAPQK
ncbi:MAG: hypothetical protein EAZ55_12640 [Cytophagales bacterium]|nr:MAG: hypothetical protein EAZ55_12640 [Cytophagales bacterium]